VTFLFWNINRQDLGHHVSALAAEHEADIVALAECSSAVSILAALNPVGRNAVWIYASTFVRTKVELFIKGDARFTVPLFDGPRISIREIRFPATQPFLLALIHLASGLHYSEEDKAAEAREINSSIGAAEQRVGYSRTLVLGDFNMNPYSAGVFSANGFNAVMTRDVAATGLRNVGGKSFPYFFNPMWNLFGDGDMRIPGTYYYRPSGYASVHWHIFDQVLLRPHLMHRFRTEDVEILHGSSIGSLINNRGKPNVSDHLPIKFKLGM
jgi:hypothetical protein